MKLSWWRTLLIVMLCFPSLVMGWVIGLISLLGFAKSPKPDDEYPFVLTVVWRPWFAERWKYSTTLGFFMGMHPKTLTQATGRTKKHERVHIRQLIDRGILADILAALAVFVNVDLAFALWLTAPVWQLPNFLGALLRGGHIYRDAEHERSAYAGTNTIEERHVGKNWLEIFAEEKRGF